MTDLLSIADLDAEAFAEILALSERTDLGRPLEGKGVALVFQKPSARTRNSMEMAASSSARIRSISRRRRSASARGKAPRTSPAPSPAITRSSPRG